MAINVLQAAKYLAKKSEWKLSRLELQKMVYLAHMLHLGQTGRPLVRGDWEAWKHGPVHPELYYLTVTSDSLVPKEEVFDFVQDLPNDFEGQESLDQISNQLKPGDGWKLVDIVHWEEGAWVKHYSSECRNIVIPQADIEREYLNRIMDQRKRKSNA